MDRPRLTEEQRRKKRERDRAYSRRYGKTKAHRESVARWQLKNRAKYLAARRAWYRKNCSQILIRSKQRYNSNTKYIRAYYLRNKEKYQARYEVRKSHPDFRTRRRETYNKWEARQLVTNLEFKIKRRLRERITGVLKGKYRSASIAKLIGCDISFLQWYLESRFTDGMTWEDFMRGNIHLDHHIPCAEFDLTDPVQQKQCFHYSNLRPLWARDNLVKQAKRPPTHQAELL